MPLGKSQPASAWIHDFVKSKDKRFAGKSRKERIHMALGAYYGKQNEERAADEARINESEIPISEGKEIHVPHTGYTIQHVYTVPHDGYNEHHYHVHKQGNMVGHVVVGGNGTHSFLEGQHRTDYKGDKHPAEAAAREHYMRHYYSKES